MTDNQRKLFEACREAFEAWAVPNGHEPNKYSTINGYNKYDLANIWIGYQAAWQHQAGVIGELVEALEAILYDCTLVKRSHVARNVNEYRPAAQKALAKAQPYLERKDV